MTDVAAECILIKIVGSYTNNVDHINVTSTSGPDGIQDIRLFLTVHRNEMAKTIGRQGLNILALKCVMDEIGMIHNGQRIGVSLEEPDGSESEGEARGTIKEWNSSEHEEFVKWLVGMMSGDGRVIDSIHAGNQTSYSIVGLTANADAVEGLKTIIGLSLRARGRVGKVDVGH